MTTPKGAALERFLQAPDPDTPLVLVFGPDTGLVAERTRAIIAAAIGTSDDPFAIVQLDGDAIASDPPAWPTKPTPYRCLAAAVPFASASVAARSCRPRSVFDQPPADAIIVIEAGDLKKNAPIRRRFEQARAAVAIACYPDTGQDLEKLIDREFAEAGLAIDHDARAALVAQLGADRLASRAEIEKLKLYAMGTGKVTHADVVAVSGDASAIMIDEVVDAAMTGRLAAIDHGLARLAGTGIHPSAITAIQRHTQLLHRLSADVENGRRASAVVEHLMPPPHFKRKAAVATALEAWNCRRLERALELVDEAQLDARQRPEMAFSLIGALLFRLGRAATRHAAAAARARWKVETGFPSGNAKTSESAQTILLKRSNDRQKRSRVVKHRKNELTSAR
ncbi:MAG: DNA polymerase III subunit delta [Hyphomicrobiales bacterium]